LAKKCSNGEIKINIGCGLSGAPGWDNIDNSPTVLISRLPLVRTLFKYPPWPKDVRRCDVIKGLPYPDQSVSCIYSSHTFEHFTWDDSLRVARECFRALRPGGILRVAVPDLRLIVERYHRNSDHLASHQMVQQLALGHTLQDLLHPGANHSQMFDEKSLVHLFRQAGFSDPRRSCFRQSLIPDIDRIELEVRARESLYVEAVKQD
jgi:predicted SAM-dependent methyltransferase